MNHLIIMAGGSGSRLWPMSTIEKPKQFVDVLGVGRTLIQLTADRFKGLCRPEQTWVVTSKKYVGLVEEQLPEIPRENILLEPCMRNTAPCIAYVSWKIKEKDPAANLIVSPADHVIMDTESFGRIIKKGLDFTYCDDRIVTVGIMPHRADTGYGYIKSSKTPIQEQIYKVEAFKEKPNKEVAAHYLKEQCYYWNSGIFIWNVRTVEKAIKAFCPDIASVFDKIARYFYSEKEQVLIDLYYPECENVSIDYAVMEHTDNGYIIPGFFGWCDLGTWRSLSEFLNKDISGNAVTVDTVRMVDSTNCIVSVPSGKHYILQGLTDYIVVDNQKALLICRKEDEQEIKQWIE